MKPRVNQYATQRRTVDRAKGKTARFATAVAMPRRALLPVVTVVLICGFLSLYVGVINAAAIRGGDIRDLERRITVLDHRAKELALMEARTRSVTSGDMDVQQYEYVPVDEISVIAHTSVSR